jgi:fibro-slime domain-containing protein
MKRNVLSGSMKVAVLAGAAGLAFWCAPGSATGADDPYSNYPSSVSIVGLARDFRAKNVKGGHPDMELNPPQGYGLYCGIVANSLDSDGKPAFASTGHKTSTQATDSLGRTIIGAKPYLAARSGDIPAVSSSSLGGVVTSAASYMQWFRDTPGVNTSRVFGVSMARQPGSNKYIFDGDCAAHGHPDYGGFTVNDNQSANAQGGNTNYDFTFEASLNFLYRSGQGQYFTFAGDDDLWVFINGQLVIDLGGMHDVTWQNIDLDRVSGLQDNQQATIQVFYAERHKTSSRLHIETNLQLKSVPLPPTTALAD